MHVTFTAVNQERILYTRAHTKTLTEFTYTHTNARTRTQKRIPQCMSQPAASRARMNACTKINDRTSADLRELYCTKRIELFRLKMVDLEFKRAT